MGYYNNRYNDNNRNGGNRGGRSDNNGGDAPRFGSPYNFVPINQDVLIPWWNGLASQDAPLVDSETGRITLTVTNRTPMFVRDGGKDKMKRGGKEFDFSAHVNTPAGKRYFIPGSSLRGMIRSVAEIMSFGRFAMYDDVYIGYRGFAARGEAQEDYTEILRDAQCGWVRMDNEELYLEPCGEPRKFDSTSDPWIGPIISKYWNLNAQDKHDKLEKELNKSNSKDPAELFECRYPMIAGCRLVCTGYIDGKKFDYLFGPAKGPEIKLSDELKKKFLSVYKPSPYYDKMYKTLRTGEKVPVFYTVQDGKIIHFGLTRFYRIPMRNAISNCIQQILCDDSGYDAYEGENGEDVKIQGHDMVETLFGYIDNKGKDEDKEALKGRVWIGHAFTDKVIADSQLIQKEGVLGGPHASYYPRYLQQDDNPRTPYITYDTPKGTPTLAGRKRYRIHSDDYITPLPEGNNNERVITRFMLLPAGTEFKFTVSFHNLMPEEIGLLLSAITLHGTKGVHHSIGLAKGYGYGKIDIKIDEIEGLQHDKDYYMKFFEYYINNFTSSLESGKKWSETVEVSTLMAIMTDHSEDLEMMDFKRDYKPSRKKENKPKVKLREKPVEVNTYIHGDPDPVDYEGMALHKALKKLVER